MVIFDLTHTKGVTNKSKHTVNNPDFSSVITPIDNAKLHVAKPPTRPGSPEFVCSPNENYFKQTYPDYGIIDHLKIVSVY